MRVSKWVVDTESPEYSKAYGAYAGKRVDRWMNYDFILPGILLMDSGMVPAGGGAAARETGLHTDGLEFRGRQALTPESGQLLNLGSLKTHLLAIVRRDPVDHLVVGVHADVKRLVLDRDGHTGLCAQQAALLAEQDLLGRLLAAGRA